MAEISSSDILNLSHSLKDVCEVDCETSTCLTGLLRTLLQLNLIQANLEYSKRFSCPPVPPRQSDAAPAAEFQYSYNRHGLVQPSDPAQSQQSQDTQFGHSMEHRHSFSHEHGT